MIAAKYITPLVILATVFVLSLEEESPSKSIILDGTPMDSEYKLDRSHALVPMSIGTKY